MGSLFHVDPLRSAGRAGAAIALAACLVAQSAAHENHAPLPAKGVKVAGDTIMLSDKAREAIGLTTGKVVFGDIHRTVVVNARVELPWHAQAMITSLVPGKIDEVLVRPGDAVTAGQVLARVVSPELETLQTEFLQAKAEAALARKLVDQRTALGQQGAIPGKTLLEAQATLSEKLAAVEIARQKLFVLGFDAASLQPVEQAGKPQPSVALTSPRSGVITHADVRLGQIVSPADHLYHVVDTARLWIACEVLESDIRYLKGGQPVTATFAALSGKTFTGAVDHLRPALDRRTRTQRVVVAVENPAGDLRPGMSGRVSISVDVAEEAILCPGNAIITSRTGAYVLVQRVPGRYVNRPVKLGLTENGRVEVLDGLFPGDQVVVTGSALLSSLMGNEHKARVDDNHQAPPLPQATTEPACVAHATVELPTDRQTLAAAHLEGRITRICVDFGQEVAAGDVLAEVDSLELRGVQLDLLQTLTHARFTEETLSRLDGLAGQGVASKRQVWELQSELETLRLRIESLRSKLAFLGMSEETVGQLARVDLTQPSDTIPLARTVPVRAPAGGLVAALNVVPGQVVHPRDTLFEIHDLSTVWVKGYVVERDIERVKLGQTARATFAAYPDVEATGKIVRIAPTMEEGEQVLPVWVEVANPDRLLKDGMLARIAVWPDAPADEAVGDVARIRDVQPRK